MRRNGFLPFGRGYAWPTRTPADMQAFRTPRVFPAAIGSALVGSAAIGSAHGTTSEAWSTFEREVIAACTAANNLRDTKASGKLIGFDDQVGFTATVIDGRYP